MDLGLKGKSVLVSAASKGLGKASALAFAREGANVTIASRHVEHLELARSDIHKATGQQVSIVQMDVTSQESIAGAIQSVISDKGGLDVLVSNAGGPRPGQFSDLDDEAWLQGFQLSLLSTIRMIREALPYMKAGKGGRIVNLTSTSIKQPIPGLLLSNVFRTGVHALTKSLASELAADGILINTIAPGRIATDRIAELDQQRSIDQGRPLEAIQAEAVSQIPLGRLGTPEEFANIVAFYGSYANTYVTGQALLVDGGMVKAL